MAYSTYNDTNYRIKWKVRSAIILSKANSFQSKRSTLDDFTNDFTPRLVVEQGGSLKERNEFALSGGV